MSRIRRRPLFAALAATGLARPALGQPSWPNGPIRIIVPFPPGGSVDTVTRLLQRHLTADLGVSVVIENRGGASGAIGTLALARSPADGQTWATVFDTHGVNPSVMPNIGYDTRRDLSTVMLVGTSPMLITTHVSRPWRTLPEVVAAAKARPETLTYGTIGIGSLAHLTMSLMQRAGGFSLIHVPYRGGGPMSTAAAAGELDMPVGTNAGLGGQVGQTLRPLAQTGGTRSAHFPDLPTVVEAGIPGIDALAWWGVIGRAGVPEAVTRRFHASLAKALAAPEVQARLSGALGIDLVGSTPEAFGSFLETQTTTWARVVRENNIRVE